MGPFSKYGGRLMKQFIDSYNALIEEAREKLADEIIQHFRPFFEKYPQISEVYWNQYTPSYCDGDACEFSVRSIDTLPDYDNIHSTLDDEDLRNVDKLSNEEIVNYLESLHLQICELPSAILQTVLGDPVRVIVSKDNLYIEDYEVEY